ncbi:Eco57I restriction-modification methylase domain-containing protein [Dialister sp.]|uniref:Eco57I restriction-modification methylase domain-containing protein n=1 Tax=Dialister sp. TaxID=1955814 RepID=UPI003A5C638C
MDKLIDVTDPLVRAVLPILLQDKTTKRNIIWATDTYADYGEGFFDKQEITVPRLLNAPDLIKPRILKSLQDQQTRTKKKAEVFTPAWLCNEMNNFCDEEWFGRKTVFNIECDDHQWDVVDDPIAFPEKRSKNWKHYVDSRRLEITCGEAPFLVSRYNAATGGLINPTFRRIGILDRKLRVVNEYTDTFEEWLKWTIRAFESVYGYEYQGDSLLIARINMFLTFIDYYRERWQKDPEFPLLKKIANKIAWNLWQMDGFEDTVPVGMPPKAVYEPNLFEDEVVYDKKVEKIAPACKMQDWRDDRPKQFHELKGRHLMNKKSLFDVAIGNPPYQQSDGGAGVSAIPVYNKFLEEVKKINPEIMCFVIPAKWYSGGGRGLDKFRKDMLSDPHISILEDYTNSADLFTGVDIAGGVCIFVRNTKYTGKCNYTNHFNGATTRALRDLNENETFIRYPIAADIIKKVSSFKESTLDNVVCSQKPFGLRTYVKPEKQGDLILRFSGGRGPFKREDVTAGQSMIDQWKIIISRLTAEHAGQPDRQGQFRVLSTMEMLKPKEICTETYMVAGSFNTELEAINYMNYLKSKFVRFLVQQIALTQQLSRSSFKAVPVQNFQKSWTDEELYKKYGLNDSEIGFIEKTIKEMH